MTLGRFFYALPLALALAGPAVGADKDKKEDKEAAEEKLVPIGQLTGTLRAVGSDKFITVQVQLRIVQPNLQAAYNQLQQQLQILRSPPAQRPRLIRQMLQQGPAGVQVTTINQDIELEPAAELKVRVLQPPPAFDDKGNPKRYTAKELKELKGEGNLPGYQADLSNLSQGQIVTAFLARPAKMKKDKDEIGDNKPIVRMIVILADPQR